MKPETPFPDAARRAEIWRRVFPRQTPTENFDAAKLAHLNVAGDRIRSIALNASFLAADAGQPVRMSRLLAPRKGSTRSWRSRSRTGRWGWWAVAVSIARSIDGVVGK